MIKYSAEAEISTVEDFQQKFNFKPPRSIKSGNYKVLSLFSGCGGLDLGFQGGFEFKDKKYSKNKFSTVLANDINPAAALVYEKNKKYFGRHNIIQEDIRNIPSDAIPEFDFLLAGFPCQPFSNAGNRKGIDDERGNLFEECERIIKDKIKIGKEPIGFVFENVRGIMSSKMPDGTTIPEEIKSRMNALGYATTYKLIKASKYGVPSQRYRCIIIGVQKKYGEFDFEYLDKVIAKFKIPTEDSNKYELMVGTILCDIDSSMSHSKEFWKYSPSGQYMVDKIGPCFGDKKLLNKIKRKTPIEKLPEEIHKGRSWKNMDRADMSERFQKIHDNPKKYRAPNFYRRFSLTEINGTITASAQPEACGITHPLENRRYTIREIARIQSFPDDFVFPYTTIANAYRVIGNAVPPILGWVLARGLSNYLSDND